MTGCLPGIFPGNTYNGKRTTSVMPIDGRKNVDKTDIEQLIDKFDDSSLSELSIEEKDFSITLKRELTAAPAAAPGHVAPAAPAVGAPAPVMSAPPAEAAAEAGGTEGGEVITAPLVGTFYRSPAPDAPVYVEDGSRVALGDSLCIIEAMKIMNKLEAEFPCEIVKVLAQNGTMVEFGTPLFEVRRI